MNLSSESTEEETTGSASPASMERPSGRVRKLTLDLWLSYCDTLKTAAQHPSPKQYVDRIHKIYKPLFTVEDAASLEECLKAVDGFRQMWTAVCKEDMEDNLQTFELVSAQLREVLKRLYRRSQVV